MRHSPSVGTEDPQKDSSASINKGNNGQKVEGHNALKCHNPKRHIYTPWGGVYPCNMKTIQQSVFRDIEGLFRKQNPQVKFQK